MDAHQNTPIYNGQFGQFTITEQDRRGVVIYRSGLAIAAVAFALGVALVCLSPASGLPWISWLYTIFWASLGVSLATIHIYLIPLHRALQIFWAVGGVTSLVVAHTIDTPFVQSVYDYPLTLLGVGFTFVALTGIFFKEAFCFDRLETKLLTPLVPLLLLGHMGGIWPIAWEQTMLVGWAVLFGVFALRKALQPIPPDIGDKSVFDYLKNQATASS
jgi:uncharacterized integral membrane protein